MKKIYLAFLLMGVIGSANAQTTAQNWTKNDCSGKSHNLFAELDSSNVVVLEYVMMNCGSCVTAGNGLKTVTTPYATSHPGRVRMYSIGYNSTYTCSQMDAWKTSNNFTHPVFTDGTADVAYYGGMGMPTIVVVGNNSHTVYYKKLGYSGSDNAAITAAIDLALSASGPTGISEASKLNVELYPNPSTNLLNLTFEAGEVDLVRITDLTGKLILDQKLNKTMSSTQLQTDGLKAGLYLVNFLKNGKVTATKKFVKTEN